jgi:hypothetical protein
VPNQRRRLSEPRSCETCGGQFYPRADRPASRHCSQGCYLSRPGQDAAGAKNPNWKGGVSQDHYAYTKRFRSKNPEKARAHRLVSYAKQTGKLVPQPCEECGAADAHAHHEDYSKPLEVRWVCQRCHNRHHHLGAVRAPAGAP